jgi:MoxR-like ATPase
MHALDVQEQARMMMAAHGSKAIAEAAQRAVELMEQGREEEARDWRRIEAALVQMAGPRAK